MDFSYMENYYDTNVLPMSQRVPNTGLYDMVEDHGYYTLYPNSGGNDPWQLTKDDNPMVRFFFINYQTLADTEKVIIKFF